MSKNGQNTVTSKIKDTDTIYFYINYYNMSEQEAEVTVEQWKIYDKYAAEDWIKEIEKNKRYEVTYLKRCENNQSIFFMLFMEDKITIPENSDYEDLMYDIKCITISP